MSFFLQPTLLLILGKNKGVDRVLPRKRDQHRSEQRRRVEHLFRCEESHGLRAAVSCRGRDGKASGERISGQSIDRSIDQ